MAIGGAGAADAGFTVVFCSGRHCRSPLPVRERLGASVRGCVHGMLVGSPCLFGRHGCPGNVPAAAVRAPVLLAQRCAGLDRHPVGPTLTLGPLRSRRDLEAVCEWLVDPTATLPAVLDPRVRQVAAPLN